MHKHAIFYIFIFTTTFVTALPSQYRETKSSLLRKQGQSRANVFELRAQAERESLNRVNGISSNLQPFLPKKLEKVTRTNTSSSSYLPSDSHLSSEVLQEDKVDLSSIVKETQAMALLCKATALEHKLNLQKDKVDLSNILKKTGLMTALCKAATLEQQLN